MIAPAGIRSAPSEPSRATVERTEDHDNLTEEIKELLGWGDDDDDEEQEISREHVDRYEDDAIHLRERPRPGQESLGSDPLPSGYRQF